MEKKRRLSTQIYFPLFLAVLFILVVISKLPQNFSRVKSEQTHSRTLWKYQCIDTMKTSRDNARLWASRTDLSELIEREMKAIKDMGANCVALDTPYDEEFLLYLESWVSQARGQQLIIWFRGNFSSWEGWFDHPKGMSEQELYQKTGAFIKANAGLFVDGDIFTAAPEAENGGPFNQVETDEHEAYRAFLIREHKVLKESFDAIGKKVVINWMSMNGGLAKRMFDQPTIDALDKTVTLDHYIKTAPEMGEFINYFYEKFGAKSVIGEFGAPIPDINGVMNESQQAAFVGELLRQLYRYKDKVVGINYWVLYDSSTQLYNKNFTPRKVVNLITGYFKPALIKGTVTNTLKEKVAGVNVTTQDGYASTYTNEEGNYELLVPVSQANIRINTTAPTYLPTSDNISLTTGATVEKNILLTPYREGILYKLRRLILSLLKRT